MQSSTLAVLLLLLLAVMALVLFPMFARERGSRVDTCSSHLRQLGLAMQQYAADYDGRLPNALTWPADLAPYYRDDRLLHCPDDPRKGERSYDMLQRWGYRPLPDRNADRLIALYENGKYGAGYRHTDGMYVGFCDAHVKWYTREKMTPGVILNGVAPGAAP